MTQNNDDVTNTRRKSIVEHYLNRTPLCTFLISPEGKEYLLLGTTTHEETYLCEECGRGLADEGLLVSTEGMICIADICNDCQTIKLIQASGIPDEDIREWMEIAERIWKHVPKIKAE